jgi:hypothetical protein
MKTISKLFTEAWEKKERKMWQYVYIMVDLHGVVLPSNYHSTNDLMFIDPYVKECLQYLSQQEDVILILWSSSHEEEIFKVKGWLATHKIAFKFVNENPIEDDTDYADFSEKFYFSIGLDDKFGFEPSDWKELSRWIKVRELQKMK